MNWFEKYSIPGPRYTSYPTVPYWSQTPSQKEWIQALQGRLKSAQFEGTGAGIYVHIPFCKSLCTYCGCNTKIARNRSGVEPYLSALLTEWALYRKHIGMDFKVQELHLGGGTPTYLEPDEIQRLLHGLFDGLSWTKDAQKSVEVDPRVTSKQQLKVFRDFGFDRISLGVQDFDPKVQAIVNRVQSESMVSNLTQMSRDLGFTSVNYDLIYGLPLQDISSIERTLTSVVEQKPDRIAFYSYAHVPWIKPGQRKFTEADLPQARQKRALYERGRFLLEAAGYREIGMDHFALESDELWKASLSGQLHRNFMGYTSKPVLPLIGLGVSSIGDTWDHFAQNEKRVELYEARVLKGELPIFRGHVLTQQDQILRKHILNVMTRFQTDWSLSELDQGSRVQKRLNEMSQDGMVELLEQSLKVTDMGRPFLRNICMAFDERLYQSAPTTKLFSQTI